MIKDIVIKLIKNIFAFFAVGGLGLMYQIVILIFITLCLYKIIKAIRLNRIYKKNLWTGNIYIKNQIGFKIGR